jgi:hypothetical protein
MDRSRARRVLVLFQNLNMIRTESESKTTRLTVLNYDTYNDARPDGDHIATTSRPQGDHKMNTDKKERRKEGKKERTVIQEAPARFSPPTVEQVAEYCRERNNGIDAEHFHTHYSANGWRVGRNPMRDWQAAVRTWEKRKGEFGTQPARTVYQGTRDMVRAITERDLAKQAADKAAAEQQKGAAK